MVSAKAVRYCSQGDSHLVHVPPLSYLYDCCGGVFEDLYCVYTGYGASTVINGDSTRLHCRFVCACACACQIKNLITYNP